jgi:hypothetical protein
MGGKVLAVGVVDYDAATECVSLVCAANSQQTREIVMIDPQARNNGRARDLRCWSRHPPRRKPKPSIIQ